MFCPHCGQRQISGEARFCPSCGFPLGVVVELLANGGQLPWRPAAAAPDRPTLRARGIKQGVFMMMSMVVLMPIVIFLGVSMLNLPGELIPLTAVICVMGGFLRMLYAIFFESNDPTQAAGTAAPPQPQHYVPPAVTPNYLGAPQQSPVLPPRQSTPVYARPQRYHTGELVDPPRASVPDHTTRLLDKQPDESKGQ